MSTTNDFTTKVLERLKSCFPDTKLLPNGEVVVSIKGNQYFNLQDCFSWTDVNCKVLEWLSRGAYKTMVYRSDRHNDAFHKTMREGINKFLETNFSEQDMEQIYTRLGNCCNHSLTLEFIESGFNISLLNNFDSKCYVCR